MWPWLLSNFLRPWGWLWASDPLGSTSQLPALQAYTAIPAWFMLVLRTEPRASFMPEEHSPSGAHSALFLGGFYLLYFSRNGLSQTCTSCSVTFKMELWCQARWCRLQSHLLEHVRWEDRVLKLRNSGLMWPTWEDHLSQVIIHDIKKPTRIFDLKIADSRENIIYQRKIW